MEPRLLSALPVELLCAVFRILDPIALVATSQTCVLFRKIIRKPTRRLLAERLLALELLEEHGGVTPIFTARNNSLTPDWSEEAWNNMKWACTNCLRLLSHWHFDNHSLLGLGLRKPLPDSEAAHPITSWEALEGPLRRDGGRQRERRRLQLAEDKRVRRLYEMAACRPWGCGVPWSYHNVQDLTQNWRLPILHAPRSDFAASYKDLTAEHLAMMTEADGQRFLDEIALAIEFRVCGADRLRRHCNACRFQLGDFARRGRSRHSSNVLTPEKPAIKSRQLRHSTALDRWFPALGDYIYIRRDMNASTWKRLTHRQLDPEGDSEAYWPLYMVRCNGCGTWQEGCAFIVNHVGAIGPRNSICAGCVLREHTAEVLRDRLLQNFYKIFAQVETECARDLSLGWKIIKTQLDGRSRGTRNMLEQLLTGLEWSGPYSFNHGATEIDVHKHDLDDLRSRYAYWRDEIWPRFSTNPSNQGLGCDTMRMWTLCYDRVEAQWVWLQALKRKIEAAPDVLVQWSIDLNRKAIV